VLAVLRLVESGDLELLSSEALEFEINRIPHQHRKRWATEMLKLANHVIELNDEIEAQADNFVQAGIRPWMLCIWLQHHGRKRIISVPVMIGY
jgi:hypothetical protein